VLTNLVLAFVMGFAILTILFVVSQSRTGQFSHVELPPYSGAPWIRLHLLDRFPQLEQTGGADRDRDVLARLIAERKVAFRVSRAADHLSLALLVPRDRLNESERQVVALLFAERSWTNTKLLGTPVAHASRVGSSSPRAMRRSLFVLMTCGVAAYVGATIVHPLSLLFGGCSIVILAAVSGFAFLFVAFANGRRLSAPRSAIAITIIAAALPLGAIVFLSWQGEMPLTKTVLVALPLWGLIASAMLFTFAEKSSASEEQRQTFAAARTAANQLDVDKAVRAAGLNITEDGFRPPLGVFTVRRIQPGRLSAEPRLGPGAARFQIPPVVRPDEVRIGDGQFPFETAGTTEGVTWTARSDFQRIPTNEPDPDYRVEWFTVWRTERGAIDGVLQFWPRWADDSAIHSYADDAEVPQIFLTVLLPRLGGTYSDARVLADVARLPVDDERLLAHYKVYASARIDAQIVNPHLKQVLIDLAESVHRQRAGAPNFAFDPIGAMSMIMFWRRGLAIYSTAASRDPMMIATIALFGAECAQAVSDPTPPAARSR
jgi:hypothetical protein